MAENRISIDHMNASELALSVGLTAVGGIMAYFLPGLISVSRKNLPKINDDLEEKEADKLGSNIKGLEAELEGEEKGREAYKFAADRNFAASNFQFGSDHPDTGEGPSIHHEGTEQGTPRYDVQSLHRENASTSSQIIPVQIVGGARVGKSTIAEAFVKGSIQRQVKSSYGANLYFKSLYIEGRKVYLQSSASKFSLKAKKKAFSVFQVWESGETKPDTPSSHPNHLQYKATVLVYSVEENQSIQAMKDWWSCKQADNSNQGNIVAVIGNRKLEVQKYEADSPMARHGLAYHKIKDNSNSIAEVEEFCEANKLSHFLMSSSNDVKTISQAFHFVLRTALQLS